MLRNTTLLLKSVAQFGLPTGVLTCKVAVVAVVPAVTVCGVAAAAAAAAAGCAAASDCAAAVWDAKVARAF